MKFRRLIKTKMIKKIEIFLVLELSDGLFIAIQCFLLIKRSVLGNAYCVLTQTRLFSHDVPYQTGRFFGYRTCADNDEKQF